MLCFAKNEHSFLWNTDFSQFWVHNGHWHFEHLDLWAKVSFVLCTHEC